MRRVLLTLCLMLATLSALAFAFARAQDGAPRRVDVACGFGQPVKPFLWVYADDGTSKTYPIDTLTVQRWRALEGVPTWRGYEDARPFGYSPQTRTVTMLSWVIADADAYTEQRLYLLWDPESHGYYLLPFDDMSAYAAPDGAHYGIHPCGVYLLSAHDARLLLDRVRSFYDATPEILSPPR